MGAVYSVTLEITLKDEKAAIKALQEHAKTINALQKDIETVEFDTLDGLMKLYLAEYQNPVDIDRDENFCVYSNDFNATYNWEMVLADMFKTMTPYLEDGSKMEVYPDNGFVTYRVRDGECICEDDFDEEEED